MMPTGVSLRAAFLVPVIGTKIYLYDNWRTILFRLVRPMSAWRDALLMMIMVLFWWMSRVFTMDFARQIYNSPVTATRIFINHLARPFIALWQVWRRQTLGAALP